MAFRGEDAAYLLSAFSRNFSRNLVPLARGSREPPHAPRQRLQLAGALSVPRTNGLCWPFFKMLLDGSCGISPLSCGCMVLAAPGSCLGGGASKRGDLSLSWALWETGESLGRA